MTKYYKHGVEDEDGWTCWIHPLKGYKMACWDCGLVHDLEFSIDEENRFIFRARRNERATAAKRRKKT